MANAAEAETLVVAAVQPPLRPAHVSPLEAAHQVVSLMQTAQHESSAKKLHIDLFVLPELAPIGYSQDTFENWLLANEKIHSDIHTVMGQACRDLNAYVCFGTVGTLGDGKFTMRQIVLDPTGNSIMEYDKKYLCDYGDCSETRYFTSPTAKHTSFSCRGFNIGILVCADMRYPTNCRRLVATQHLDVVLQPAAFSRDCSFYTWKSFRETRAVENSIYWVGVNYAGEDYGNSNIVGPWVDESNVPNVAGTESVVLVDVLSKLTLKNVRDTMPFHRALLSEQWE